MFLDEGIFPLHVGLDVVGEFAGESSFQVTVGLRDRGMGDQVVAKRQVPHEALAMRLERVDLMRSDSRGRILPEITPPRDPVFSFRLVSEERSEREAEQKRLAAQQEQDSRWLMQLRAEAESARAQLKQSLEDKRLRFAAQQKGAEERMAVLQRKQRSTTQSLIRNEWNVSNIGISVEAFDPDRNATMNYSLSFSRYGGQITLDQTSPHVSLVDVNVKERAMTDYALGIPIRWDRVTLTFVGNAVLDALSRIKQEQQATKESFELDAKRLEDNIARYNEMIRARSVTEAQRILKTIKNTSNEAI